MKYNKLGTSELLVSEIGFGCMSIGTDEPKAISLLHEAMDLGINFFDTSDLYDYGQNEVLLGKAIKGRRDKLVVATKVGNRRIPGKEGWVWDPTKAYIKEAVKGSLQRLQTDYIDLYQLHGGTLEDNIDETIEAFEELKREGIIRYYGISSIRPNVIREYVNRSHIVSLMTQYSILDRRPEEEVLPLLEQHGINAIVRGPVASGLISERFREKAQEGYLDYSRDELIDMLEKLEGLADDSRSLSQIALRYALAHPAVASVIPGSSRPEQLLANAAAGNVKLKEEEIEWIRTISKVSRYVQHRS
ncbi:aldo/keto reductase [Brevibacillus fluminis]|uniref:Aldo/keto reductase n=1 Tax=Brevibacillus fluminis TaxID=511487 RepID=A0A3M8DBK6_9BACL|nr:aldo/keto reductase [Brevibacillus fluminis]RNB84695.1 aldo/keto reductase [Brevibacillus fluminis]